MLKQLPPKKEMFDALMNRDSKYEGIFLVGVKTTGVFCRPTCPARKPKMKNVEFFSSAKQALDSGYRPCKRCRPMQPKGKAPEWVEAVWRHVEKDPSRRWTDREIEMLDANPNRLRRWFKKHHGMTFHDYLRLRRLGMALGRIKHGDNITQAAFDHGYESLSGFRDAIKNLTGKSAKNGKCTTVVYLNRVLTPLGPMLAGTTETTVCLLEFVDRRMLETQLNRLHKHLNCAFIPGSNSLTEEVNHQLQHYFKGGLKKFSLPLETPGSEFQKKVWKQLQAIPYGRTCSYEEQAQAVGNKKAVRAVAGANGDNRIAIIIPCHRVIGKNGQLTGYGGGLWRKKYLLNLEKSHSINHNHT